MNTSLTKYRYRLLAIFLLALAVRLAWIALNYTADFSAFQDGDYTLYAIGGEHILQQGDFSNSLFLVRPPLFPLIIAALDLNTGAVLIFNALVGALAAPLTAMFAGRVGLAPRWAAAAGILVAIDPPGIVYSAYLGPEAIANTLLLLVLWILWTGIDADKHKIGLGIASGLLLVLAAYARPASYLLWIPLGIGIFVFFRKQKRLAVAFMLCSALGIGAWTAHNGLVFETPAFSTIGVYNLLYYRAASVQRMATGQPIDDVYVDLSARVEELLGRDPSAADTGTRHEHYAAAGQTQNAMQAVALDVFKSYPLAYAAGIPIGLARFLIVLNGMSGWAEVIVMLWNLVFLALAAVGIEVARRARNYRFAGLSLLLTAYFIVGTLAVQTSGIDTRARTMLTPIMALAAAFALSAFKNRRWLK